LDEGPFIDEGVKAFSGALKTIGFCPQERVLSLVQLWLKHLFRWKGRKVTALREPREIGVKLLADSFGFFPEVQFDSEEKGLALGSGNGWPGLAIKMVRESSQVGFLDSRLSACRFLSGYLESAKLDGTAVLWHRAEEAARNAMYRERFTMVVSRAMAGPRVMLEIGAPFLTAGGRVVLWLGPGQESEMPDLAEEAGELGLGVPFVKEYDLPYSMGKRLLAVFRKEGSTPDRFPRRKVKVIREKPLGSERSH